MALTTNLAVIADTFCQNDIVAPGQALESAGQYNIVWRESDNNTHEFVVPWDYDPARIAMGRNVIITHPVYFLCRITKEIYRAVHE